MKKLSLLLLAFGFLTITYSEVNAQAMGSDYKNAIGGRFGAYNGVTFKTFIKNEVALDFILNFRSKKEFSTFRLNGLYEIHKGINNAPGLRWYYGAGAGIGAFKWKHGDASDLFLSIDGVLGLDYKFNGAPINLALDWKPAIQITPDTEFDGAGVGLSIRFAF